LTIIGVRVRLLFLMMIGIVGGLVLLLRSDTAPAGGVLALGHEAAVLRRQVRGRPWRRCCIARSVDMLSCRPG
jgi:hypothetical protein